MLTPEQGQALLGLLMLLALCSLRLLARKGRRVSGNQMQRVAPKPKVKSGPAWEQDEVWPECFDDGMDL